MSFLGKTADTAISENCGQALKVKKEKKEKGEKWKQRSNEGSLKLLSRLVIMLFNHYQERGNVEGEGMENNCNKCKSLELIGFENVQKPF